MTQRYWKDWHSALGALLDGLDGRLEGRQVMSALSQLVFLEASAIFHYGSGERPTLVFDDFAKPWRNNRMADYLTGAYLLDPFYHLAQEGQTGLYRLSDVASATFHRSAYYLSYYRQGNVGDEVNLLLPTEGGVLALSIERSARKPRFTSAELARLESARPLLEPLLRRTWRAPSASSRADRRAAHDDLLAALGSFGSSLLTHREQQILQLLFRGYSTDAMSERLAITRGTVKVHRKRIYEKLDINSQAELLPMLVGALSCVTPDGPRDPLAAYMQRPSPGHAAQNTRRQ